MLNQISKLLRIDSKGGPVSGLHKDSAHASKETVPNRPLWMTQTGESCGGLPCLEPLLGCSPNQHFREEDDEELPLGFMPDIPPSAPSAITCWSDVQAQ
jgi:hypothetical protein